jgi:arylsulfate sulfotransferase
MKTTPAFRSRLSSIALAVVIAGCGGGESSTHAEKNRLSLSISTEAVNPFIGAVQLKGLDVSSISDITFRVDPKAASSTLPVKVTYSAEYLRRKGFVTADAGSVRVPVFGLYAGRTNTLTVDVAFQDGSTMSVPSAITTTPYVDPNKIYDRPTVIKAASSPSTLGFSYFYAKSGLGTPVVIDTDGEVRWVGAGTTSSIASTFHENSFVVGDASLRLQQLDLDGTVAVSAPIANAAYRAFDHNFDLGKVGILVEIDTEDSGVSNVQRLLTEVKTDGTIVAEWNFETIMKRHMLRAGDDPSVLVRPGIDWFHMNAATYDPRDDSIIVSSRENFVVKVDYTTGEIKWIFGDPSKYWHTVPSLKAKSLVLGQAGIYPSGQHAVSIAPNGDLLLFDNGQPASNPPNGTLAGEYRPYSSVASFAIDPIAATATQRWRFDYEKSVKSPFCSSAYQSADESTLISYATLDNYTRSRLVGLDKQRNVVFDFQYDASACNTSWNAQPLPLESMTFK